MPLTGPRLRLLARTGEPPRIAVTTRIGVRAAADLPYRFVAAGSRYLSVPWHGEEV
jgi:3-methyladenine DNA glycosylase Mpg